MTEPDKGAEAPANLSGQEIAAKFSSRFPEFRCSVCGAEDFVVLDRVDEGYSSKYVVYEAHSDRPTESTETLGIACQNCGHVYQFALDILRRRLRSTA